MPLLCNANSVVDFQVKGRGSEATFVYEPEITESKLARLKGKVDLFLAGPPCQGHSNLNNHTRRGDPRNLLYLGAVAIGLALQAKALVIENVPDVTKDKQQVVESAKAALVKAGYQITDSVLNAQDLGCAQTRRRHFLVASSELPLKLDEVAERLRKPPVDVEWAIDDLLEVEDDSLFDSASMLSRENLKRIDYLFDNDQFELPDPERPECHKNGHTYPSVYGRLRWDQAAGTITTGFQTPGRGRFIHPLKRRVLTPHEAARLQGFPDTFKFSNGPDLIITRRGLSKWIGDAVPPALSYVATACALLGISEIDERTKQNSAD
jgi:DNA (cytosine-5)-methyltransferase 1